MTSRFSYPAIALLASLAVAASGDASTGTAAGRIAFATNRAQNLDRAAIYSVPESGGARRLVGLPALPYSSIARSPNGRRILFARDAADDRGLFVADPSGERARRLTPVGMTASARDAAFTRDGRRVAFVGSGAIWVVNVDGSGARRVVEGGSPSWSPDGRRLVYRDHQGVLAVIAADGRARKELGPGLRAAWGARNRIAYAAFRGGYEALCLVDADGSHRRCFGGFSARRLLWSPDAKMLAFSRVTPPALGLVGADGRGLRFFAGHRSRGPVPLAWAPDSRRIAYTRDYVERAQIMTRSIVGPSARLQATNEPPNTLFSEARWRGGRLSYIAVRWANDFEIALMSADGHGLRALTQNFVDDREPDLSPDRRTIVYRRTDRRTEGSRMSLRLVGVDGAHDRLLMRAGAWQDFSPAWSPDGGRIAFVRWQNNHGRLMVVNRDGSGLRVLSSERDYYGGGISWSPDGRELVVAGRSVSGADLFVVPADGGATRGPLIGAGAFAPAWSPDGARVLFWGSGPMGPTQLFTVRPDGTDPRKIAEEGLANVSLGGSWSPDGRRIVFARGTAPAIVVTDGDGGNLVQLTRDASSNVDPDWGP